jgi:hypothetical protein
VRFDVRLFASNNVRDDDLNAQRFAVLQLGIATTLINTLFMATVGALALALGLAFGLGGRDTAAQIVRGWYDKGQQAAPKMAQAADRMQLRAEDLADGGASRPANVTG